MTVEPFSVGEQDVLTKTLAAELTDAAYRVVLRHGVGGKWLDLQLDLWSAITQAIENRS